MRKSTDPDLRISAARSYALVRRGRFCPQKKRMTVLQLDLRRNATRCTAYYTGSSTDLQAVFSAERAAKIRSCATCMSRSPPTARGGSKSCFPNGGRERHALPMERLFASKGPQRTGAPFADFPYALVGVPPIFGAPAGRSVLPAMPITVPRRAGQLRVRVRPQDGVSQCRLYIIMYSWAAGSEAPWKTIPRHVCRAPFCRN